MVFDGDCDFCRYWILRWKYKTEDRIDYAPYQKVSPQFTEIPLKEFQRAVQLITPKGEVYSGAAAVFHALAEGKSFSFSLWIYRSLPLAKPLTEWFYNVVAKQRAFFSRLTRWIWGKEVLPSSHFIARHIFLRFMGVIYCMAFLSLLVQIQGLIGSQGIIPVQSFLEQVGQKSGAIRYLYVPTVFWVSASDTFLHVMIIFGVMVSVLAVLGFASPLVFFILWALYLSVFAVSGDFLSFQWDILLLETGFLSLFLAPLQMRLKVGKEPAPSKAVLFLLQLLLFKLMFSSGLVKLLSGDETWRNLTALQFHFETQPLPIWTSWYIHHLPGWFHKISVISMFVTELFFSLLIMGPRRIRYVGFFCQAALQILIFISGNYCFFNLLALALCLLLLDDSFWPQNWQCKIVAKRQGSNDFPVRPWPRAVIAPLMSIILVLTLVFWPSRFGVKIPVPRFALNLLQNVNALHLVNNYGLFAVMTTKRYEIIIEGSNDGKTWIPYEFKYKPDELKERPGFVAPHQPRVDWQMWFAALGEVRQNPWFVNLCLRLLQGSKPVLNLLEKTPFPNAPPRYLRALMYDYHFTTAQERKETSQWWKRDNMRVYLPPISLKLIRS